MQWWLMGNIGWLCRLKLTLLFICIPQWNLTTLEGVLKLGCGGGFMSVGFKAAGFEISMGVDKNSRFASTYHENDLGSFIPGCMGDSEVIKKIFATRWSKRYSAFWHSLPAVFYCW